MRQNDQAILLRHEIHERFPGNNDASQRMNSQFSDRAGFGRPNHRSAEDFARCLNTLEELKTLGLCVTHALGDLRVPVTLQLQDHRLRFSDGLLGPRDLSERIADPSVNFGLLALKLQKASLGLQAFCYHCRNGFQFLLDDFSALRGGFGKEAQRCDLADCLLLALLDDFNTGRLKIATRIKNLGLSSQDLRERIVTLGGRQELLGKRDRLRPVSLRFQACFEGLRLPQLYLQDLNAGTRPGVVQPNQRLSGANFVTILHQDAPDNSPLKMLNGLSAQFRLDNTSGDGRTFERRKCRPGTETDDEHANHPKGQDSEHAQASERCSRWRRQNVEEIMRSGSAKGFHDAAPFI